MAVRSSMSALIARVRVMINDTLPAGSGQVFSDDDIQSCMDESRMDIRNVALTAKPTFAGSSIQYLDYYYPAGGWEDDLILKQFLINIVTPATSEPITAHWTFAASTLPPVYITGKLYDVYCASADLLDRWAARWVLAYSVSVDGQSFQRGQAATALQALAHTYRLKSRATSTPLTRTDLASEQGEPNLHAQGIDYFGSGDGR